MVGGEVSVTLISAEPCWAITDAHDRDFQMHYPSEEAAQASAADQAEETDEPAQVPKRLDHLCWKGNCDQCGYSVHDAEGNDGIHIPGTATGFQAVWLDGEMAQVEDGRWLCEANCLPIGAALTGRRPAPGQEPLPERAVRGAQ